MNICVKFLCGYMFSFLYGIDIFLHNSTTVYICLVYVCVYSLSVGP